MVARRGSHIVSDLSATQPVVSLSSGESEFYAIVRGITIALFLRNLMKSLGIPTGQSKVYSDSAAGRGMISRLGVGKRVKHMDVQFMFAQGVIRDGIVEILPVASAENEADVATKYVGVSTLNHLLAKMAVRVVQLATLTGVTEAKREDTDEVDDTDRGYLIIALIVTVGCVLAAWKLTELTGWLRRGVVHYVDKLFGRKEMATTETQTDLTGEVARITQFSSVYGS